MDKLKGMRVAVAIAESGSLTAAAERLNLTLPTVVRVLADTERALGTRLFVRTTRRVRITEEGRLFTEASRAILGDVAEMEEALRERRVGPVGMLNVTAPVLFGKIHVVPIVLRYQLTYEHTVVSALFVDRIVDLVDEGFDVGIRIGELPDSSLRAVRVGRVKRLVVAAPGYLAEHGIPERPADLAHHRLIGATSISSGNTWVFHAGKTPQAVKVQPRILVNSNDSAIDAARQGFGITRVLSYQAAPLLATGELRTVLAEFEGPDLPIHVIHRETRQASAKVRSFVDLAVQMLREEKSLS